LLSNFELNFLKNEEFVLNKNWDTTVFDALYRLAVEFFKNSIMNLNSDFRFKTQAISCFGNVRNRNPWRSHFYNDTIEFAKAGYFPNDPIHIFIVATDDISSPYDNGFHWFYTLIGLIYDGSIRNWTWSNGTEYDYSNFTDLEFIENIFKLKGICDSSETPDLAGWLIEINQYGLGIYLCPNSVSINKNQRQYLWRLYNSRLNDSWIEDIGLFRKFPDFLHEF
jgi:hypothetical protein